ncbi:hypothetical protein [Streptomyces enissocaesilis]
MDELIGLILHSWAAQGDRGGSGAPGTDGQCGDRAEGGCGRNL